jgi:CBS domain-containing protein
MSTSPISNADTRLTASDHPQTAIERGYPSMSEVNVNHIEVSSGVLSAAVDLRGVYIEAGRLQRDDAAVYAMTDFRREHPICVLPNRSIDEALEDMNRLSIHALLVTQPRCSTGRDQMLGLITSYRIERRQLYARRLPKPLKHCVCNVEELMTPWEELALVHFPSLLSLKAFELSQMFQGSGLTHALVVESDEDDSFIARGLISRAALSNRLREPRRVSPTNTTSNSRRELRVNVFPAAYRSEAL